MLLGFSLILISVRNAPITKEFPAIVITVEINIQNKRSMCSILTPSFVVSLSPDSVELSVSSIEILVVENSPSMPTVSDEEYKEILVVLKLQTDFKPLTLTVY